MGLFTKLFHKTQIDVTQLDRIKQVGTYQVKIAQTNLGVTPGPYLLEVKPGPIQLLYPIQLADDLTGTRYFRSYSHQFKRYNSFIDLSDQQRAWVKQYLTKLGLSWLAQCTPDQLNIGVVTDTHDKADQNKTYYGTNGLRHVQELNILADLGLLDYKAHLGDMIDGSDAPAIAQQRLALITTALAQGPTPFLVAEGNHDANDKYDEHTDHHRASFEADTFANIVNRRLFAQPQVHRPNEKADVYYIDKGPIRVIMINTSDVPYQLKADGTKVYDFKLTKAIRQQQFQDIIAILAHSQHKTIIFMGHADLLDPKGRNGLAYNGKTLHELFRAFNAHQKGKIHTRHKKTDFQVNAAFDFTNNDSHISAYICGHRHKEATYNYDGIQYILLNCSALMGRYHGLTTKYNQHWHRKQGEITEFAGYVLNIDGDQRQLRVFGYGAASPLQKFKF
ncbi:metallophosphoesterase family protein [Agrilactobacillus fermenti]|uniref:metallophosphoesterase family protein n=1 Tax=Agrilactobacillus fermenti TaxID=2586909 RepID=UPI003A5C5DC0